jgi:hypothetical protein
MRQVGRTGLAFQAGGIALIAAGLIGCDEGGADPEPELPAFPTFWQSWSPASEPAGPAALGLDREYQRPLPYNWYNPERVVRRRDVFLETRDQSEGEEFLRVLEFAIATERSGDWASPDSSGWFGVMRQLPPDLQDLREATSVAIWVDDFGASRGRMILDLGEISEDFYVETTNPQKGRGWLDTEDIDPEDGELTASREDFGLDNIQAADSDPPAPGDDGNDDFVLPGQEPLDYSRINGTEGNGLLDTEDLDGNDFLDQDNIYGSYVISLGEDPVSPYLVKDNGNTPGGSPGNTWRLFRVPLDEGVPVGGTPRLVGAYVRLWFDDLTPGPGKKVRIADIAFAWGQGRDFMLLGP